jgi:hypothetical protein
MRSKSFLRVVAVLALSALAVPVFARPINRDISLGRSAKFGKAEIQAGEYRLRVDGTKVTLLKDNRVVGELAGNWEQRAVKQLYDSILINRYGQIEEVRFAGDNRVLVLTSQ